MSRLPDHLALQRLSVVLRYDPSFVDALYAGPVRGVPARHRALLTAVDRRAWADDPHRRARTLTALLDELPATAAIVGAAALDGFFSAPAFRDAVLGRGVLVLAMAAWAEPAAGPIAAWEATLAKARRDLPRGAGPGLALAPGIEVASVPEGTLAARQATVAGLGPRPTEALAAGARAPRPALSGREHWLVERQDDGELAVSGVGAELAAVLTRASRPRSRKDLVRELRRRGAGADAAEILDGLIADGLLRQR